MILNKYNEIMNRITVDPEMKSRVMRAVSTSIKEQADGAAIVTEIHKSESENHTKTRTGKKAKRTPIVIISSIAAALVVVLGALYLFNMMSSSGAKAESTSDKSPNTNNLFFSAQAAQPANETEAAEETEAIAEVDSAIEPDAAVGAGGIVDNEDGNDSTYNKSSDDVILDVDNRNISADINYDIKSDSSRLERISKVLPFEIKGNGTGKLAEGITTEVFLGEGGEKMILITAQEGTDLVKVYDSSNKSEGQMTASPSGTEVKLLRIAFGNVTDLADGETSADVNAALFTKNGNTYLIIFSDIQSAETILNVVDAV